MMRARGLVQCSPGAALAQKKQLAARSGSVGKVAVGHEQFGRRPATIEPAEENRSGGFEHHSRRIAQHIREAHAGGVFAQANGVREIRVRMIFDHEVRRASLASEPRVDPLKEALAARDKPPVPVRIVHDAFLRTGGGAISFSALSMSVRASLVPSMASSRVSFY